MRTVMATLNGQLRPVPVRDASVAADVQAAEKADRGNPGHVAAPFAGVVTLAVAEGDEVAAGPDRRHHRGDEDGGLHHRARGPAGSTRLGDRPGAAGGGRRPAARARRVTPADTVVPARRIDVAAGGDAGSSPAAGRGAGGCVPPRRHPADVGPGAGGAGQRAGAPPGLDGAAVLDLCAGSGALGLEALSRGASSAVFVESDRWRRRACCGATSHALGLPGRARCGRRRPAAVLARAGRPGRTTSSSSTRPTTLPDAEVAGWLAALAGARLAGRRRAWSSSSAARGGDVAVAAAAARRARAAVRRHGAALVRVAEPRRDGAGTATPAGSVRAHDACGLSGLVRPADPRPPGRHRPGRRVCSTRSSSRCWSTRTSAACSPSTSGSAMLARITGAVAQRRRRLVPRAARRLLPRPRHRRDRQGPAGGVRLRLRAADGADEPAA